MKNILKKNQIMITALAIMIAVAGYLNFAERKLSDEELMKISGQTVITENGEEAASGEELLMGEDYSSASLEISEEDIEYAEMEDVSDELSQQAGLIDIESLDTDELSAEAVGEEADGVTAVDGEAVMSEESAQADVTEGETPGEAVFTSTTNVASLSGAKLMKEQTRAKNKETLLEIINSSTISEEQKQNAIENMIQLTDIAEKETAAEILLEAKGFEDVVVSISDSGVDVVVGMETLTDAQCAQIEDIVTRKTAVAPENIIIQCSK